MYTSCKAADVCDSDELLSAASHTDSESENRFHSVEDLAHIKKTDKLNGDINVVTSNNIGDDKNSLKCDRVGKLKRQIVSTDGVSKTTVLGDVSTTGLNDTPITDEKVVLQTSKLGGIVCNDLNSSDDLDAFGDVPDSQSSNSSDSASDGVTSVEDAESVKVKGNEAFKDGRYQAAIDLYSQALERLPAGEQEKAAVYLANRSACQMLLGSYDEATADATESIELNPNYVKAYLRRYQANEQLKKWHDVSSDINKAIELDPTLISKYGAEQRKYEMLSKQLFEKEKDEMLGKFKEFGNWALGKVGLSLDNFKVDQNADSGSYNISFQQPQK